MGTIVSRARKDGTFGHTAQIRLKSKGKVAHTESQTFDRKSAAQAWLKKRETELAEPGALKKPKDPLFKDVIDEYNATKQKEHGKTKTQVLNTIKASFLGELRCSEIDSQAICRFIKSIDAKPATRGNYMSHLASVFTVVKPLWGYPLDKEQATSAQTVLTAMGITGRSDNRTRRPTLQELDLLMNHFSVKELKRRDSIPMTRIIAFAIFSTRRQEEITRILAEDLNEADLKVTVRDMKNPGEKIGNHVETQLTPEALQLIKLQNKSKGPIWPYSGESIGTSFRNACLLLGIEGLTFHDLRHEGISRLFELGWSIPRVAQVSAHRTWHSLQRYTHIRQTGDKYKDWPWITKILGGEVLSEHPT